MPGSASKKASATAPTLPPELESLPIEGSGYGNVLGSAPGQTAAQASSVPFPEMLGEGQRIRAQQEEQRQLEEENGAIGAFALQTAGGIVRALTAPGALLAAGAEGVGSLLGSEGLQKFGRELGESTSAKAAIEAVSYAAGGGDLDWSDAAVRKYEDQRKAWPTLSSVAEFAGSATFALATGGMASGGLTAQRLAIQGAFDGAAFSAQEAYQQAAPITDLLVTTVAGGAIGAALGFGVAKAPGIARKALGRVTASKSLADSVEQIANRSALKAAVDRQSELGKMVARKGYREAAAEFDQVGRDINSFRFEQGPRKGEGVLSSKGALDIRSPEEIAQVLQEAKEDVGAKLGTFRESLDALPVASRPDAVDLLKTIRRNVIAPLEEDALGMAAPEARSALRDVYRRIQPVGEMFQFADEAGKALPFGSPQWWQQLDQVASGNTPLAFGQVQKWRQELAKRVYPRPVNGIAPPVPKNMLELQHLERTIEGFLTEATDRAVESTGQLGAYQALKRQYRSITMAADASSKKATAILGNRMFSLGDRLAAVGGAVSGTVASGGGVGAMTGFASSVAHKWIRENGRTVMAVTLKRVAEVLRHDVSTRVDRVLVPWIAKAPVAASRVPGLVVSEAVAQSPKEQYLERLRMIQDATADPNGTVVADSLKAHPGLPTELVPSVSAGIAQRMYALAGELPKPHVDRFGNRTISDSAAAEGNAKILAVFDPLSVLDDFAAGTFDQRKADYAWRHNVGLQVAVQSAIVDKLTAQMQQEERNAIPETLLTQLDFVAGFRGALRNTLSAVVANQMAQSRAAEQQPQAPRPLSLPGAVPTPVGKMMGT